MRNMSKALVLALELIVLTAEAHADAGRTRVLVPAGPAVIDTIAEGSGPPVVMLPSRGRDSEDYDAVAAAIAAGGFRVLRPQPRGIHGSTGPLDGLTLHDLAADVAAVIEAEHAGPAVVIGHAYGNWVARMLAVDRPDLVRGVVLAAAAAKSYPPELSVAVTKVADPALPEAERRRYLTPLDGVAEPLGANEQPKLERHVEARQAGGVQLRPRNVVHAHAAGPDERNDLLDPDLAGVVGFQGTTRPVAAVEHGEDDRLEYRLVGVVEGAVNEDAGLELGTRAGRIRHRGLRDAPRTTCARPAGCRIGSSSPAWWRLGGYGSQRRSATLPSSRVVRHWSSRW